MFEKKVELICTSVIEKIECAFNRNKNRGAENLWALFKDLIQL